MGVTGLWKLIEQAGKPVPVDTLENKVLAVDISIWLHQVVKGFQDSSGASLQNAHLLGLFHRLCKLLYYRIKPVFVFDGGVPLLKRETIAKRAASKNRYQNEADKIQQMLLESLMKEKVVQQALGPITSVLFSPPKQKKPSAVDEEAEDMFKLPPLPVASTSKEARETDDDDESKTASTDNDSPENRQHSHYLSNIRSIDVSSSHFQSLPADIRHEILSDMKELRKESSWGRLTELPAESNSFSSFQMKRLLKRRQVQVGLEEAEQEMSGKSLSFAELENLLSEKGVVDPNIATNRIASNEHVRFLHVKDIKKAIENEAVKKEKPSPPKVAKLEPVDEEENDFEMQKALQLSLQCFVGTGDEDNHTEEEAKMNSGPLKMTNEQKKTLASAANSLARTYMLEYGELNDEIIKEMVKTEESTSHEKTFKYNDDSILKGSEDSEQKPAEAAKLVNLSDDSTDDGDFEEVSSNADSDFIDVPALDSEIDTVGLLRKADQSFPKIFQMNEPPIPDPAMDFRLNDLKLNEKKIEIVVNTSEQIPDEDDIFADVFADMSTSTTTLKRDHEVKQINLSSDDQESNDESKTASTEKASKEADAIAAKNETEESGKKTDEIISSSTNEITVKTNQSKVQNISSILSDLDKEIDGVVKITLDDIRLTNTDTTNFDDIIQIEDNSKKTIETESVDIESKKKTPDPSEQNEIELKTEKIPEIAMKTFEEIEAMFPPSTIATEEDVIESAAELLRETKNESELHEMAAQMNEDRYNLEAERNKKERLGVSITDQMRRECMELLRLFGIPFIVAPQEAEAQCAFLNQANLTDGTITDDSDIWLFGGETVYKNFFDQNKLVMEFKANNIKKLFHVERNELIQLSILVGSDYTSGVHGIGAVTAMEILSVFSSTPEKEGETSTVMAILSGLRKFREWWLQKRNTQRTAKLRSKLKNISLNEDFPSSRVVEAYLYPTIDSNEERFTWGKPNLDVVREYARRTFGWTNRKIDEILLPVLKKLEEKTSQATIRNYFKVTSVESRQELKVSDRVRKAINQFGTGDSVDVLEGEVSEIPKKMRKVRPKKSNETKEANEETATTETEADVDAEPNERPVNAEAETKEEPKSKQKRLRKPRKAKAEVEQAIDPNQPSTSGITKRVRLPDPNAPIPQRERDKKILEENKLKAIEVLKASKKTSKK